MSNMMVSDTFDTLPPAKARTALGGGEQDRGGGRVRRVRRVGTRSGFGRPGGWDSLAAVVSKRIESVES